MMVDILYSLATRTTLSSCGSSICKPAQEVALTSHGDINLEPRYSPDDRQVAFVSTADSGHFNLYVAEIAGDRLSARETFGA